LLGTLGKLLAADIEPNNTKLESLPFPARPFEFPEPRKTRISVIYRIPASKSVANSLSIPAASTIPP